MIWLRLLFIFIQSVFKDKLSEIEQFTTTAIKINFRVWVNEADLSNLSGSRYFAFMEVCRFDIMLRSGYVTYCLKNKVVSVVASQKIIHKRPLARFMKFGVLTRVVYWDKYFMYVEHKFEHNNKQMAFGYVKVAWLDSNKKMIPIETIITDVGFELIEMERPPFLDTWLEAEKLEIKWALSKQSNTVASR